MASWHPRRSDRSAGEGRWSDKTRQLVWNGDVAAPRVRIGDGVVFADGRGAVKAVEVHRCWSLKAPAVSVAVKMSPVRGVDDDAAAEIVGVEGPK